MSSEIRDINLAESGTKKIEWVKRNCDLLRMLEEEFTNTKPFAGKKVALSVHLEAKTAYLCKVLAAGGAEMYVTGSNPLSTQDDIAAALVADGLNVFAWYGATEEEYFNHIRRVLEVGPDVIIDDGGDLVHMMHTEYTDLIPKVLGGCEETTIGACGTCMMAGVAVGVFKDLYEAGKIFVKENKTFVPNLENVKLYKKHCDAYKKIYDAVRPIVGEVYDE